MLKTTKNIFSRILPCLLPFSVIILFHKVYSKFNTDHPCYYTALVKANKQLYLIFGKYYDWLDFFRRDRIITSKTKL
ncbi:MAG: hypothetical protein B6D61_01815 [Bacteroidetes bacterium 4484_249]|nr:MAG: hypothetical protein B6D61_01815 [Bacteroidetes bacterium 4484_249]